MASKLIYECFGVTDRQIEEAVRENNLKSVEDVTSYIQTGVIFPVEQVARAAAERVSLSTRMRSRR